MSLAICETCIPEKSKTTNTQGRLRGGICFSVGHVSLNTASSRKWALFEHRLPVPCTERKSIAYHRLLLASLSFLLVKRGLWEKGLWENPCLKSSCFLYMGVLLCGITWGTQSQTHHKPYEIFNALTNQCHVCVSTSIV